MKHASLVPKASQVTITLRGEVDVATAGDLELALRAAERAAGEVTVDLTGVEFMDSAVLTPILRAHRRALDLTVIAPRRGPVPRLFELCGVPELLSRGPRHPDEMCS